jgi:predicted AAA+ superfamily ATPase
VDFVVDTGTEAPIIVQVSAALSTPDTREREVRGAEAAMSQLGVRESLLVTLHESERIQTATGVVDVLPAWRWTIQGL